MKKNSKKFRHIVRAICGLAVICVVCTGAVYDATGVGLTITEVNEFENTIKEKSVRTHQADVNGILLENNIELGIYDKMNLSGTNTVEKGDEIIIRRGKGITVDCDGTLMSTSTTHPTVGEALAENGFFLEEGDYSTPSADTLITDGMNITITRIDTTAEVREETVPFETIYKNDSSIYEGNQKISVKGVNGVIRISENVVYENGAEISRTEISRETVTEKVDQVVLKGTKKKTAAKSTTSAKTKSASVSGSSLNYKKQLSMTATAYSAFKKGGGYGVTASGMTARYGVVAVDPRVIPLGTKLYIEGYGYAVAADTGGAIKGNKIDLCFEKSNSELMAFGRKTVQVYILE